MQVNPMLGKSFTLRGVAVVVAQHPSHKEGSGCGDCVFQGKNPDCLRAEDNSPLPPCYDYLGTYYKESKCK